MEKWERGKEARGSQPWSLQRIQWEHSDFSYGKVRWVGGFGTERLWIRICLKRYVWAWREREESEKAGGGPALDSCPVLKGPWQTGPTQWGQPHPGVGALGES